MHMKLLLSSAIMSVVLACGGASETVVSAPEPQNQLSMAVSPPPVTRVPPSATPLPTTTATTWTSVPTQTQVPQAKNEIAQPTKSPPTATPFPTIPAPATRNTPPAPATPETRPRDTRVEITIPTPSSAFAPAVTGIQSGLPLPSTETCPEAMSSLSEQTNPDWQERPISSGDAAAIRFSPSNPDIVYLGIEVNMHSLYRSEDGGRSWNLHHLFDHAKDIAVHPKDPDIVFLNESGYVWRTNTGEKLLSDRLILESSPMAMVLESPYGFGPPDTSWSSVVISLSDPNVVYVARKGGGQGDPRKDRQEDSSKGSSAQDKLLDQLKRAQTKTDQKQALFRSEDGGVSFEEINDEFPVINVLFVHPSEPNTILVGSEDGLYRSTDSGRLLEQVSNHRDVVDINSVDGGLLLAATSAGIVRSDDAGITWSQSGDVMAGHTVLRVQIAPSEQSVVWATTIEGIYRSNDGGRTWNQAFGNLPAKNFQALAVHPLNPESVLVSTETFNFSARSDQLYAPGQYYKQGIYRTDDGGSTWLRSDSGIFENRVTILTAHPSRPHEVWSGAHASRGLYRSRDAGQSWSLSPSLLTHYPMQMAFFPSRPDAFVFTGSHTGQDFGVTIDSGINWFVLSEWPFLDAIRFDKERFVQGDARGGSVHLHAVTVDPSNPLVVYAGSIHDPSIFSDRLLTGSHIFKSRDAGVTWNEIGENYPREIQTSIRVITVDPSDSDVIYLGTSKQESIVGNGLWKSLDAGRTWRRSTGTLPPDASINAIVVNPSNPRWLLVGTEHGVYRSSDAADTWHRVSDWGVWDIETDPQHPNNIYAGTEAGLQFSSDFGETWRRISPDQLSRPIIAIAVNCNGTAVYVSDGEHGVKAAFTGPAASIPVDETTGVEYGKFTSTNSEMNNLGASNGPNR